MDKKPMYPAMVVIDSYGKVAFPAEVASMILPHLTHFNQRYIPELSKYVMDVHHDELKFIVVSAEDHTAARVRHKLEQANKEGG